MIRELLCAVIVLTGIFPPLGSPTLLDNADEVSIKSLNEIYYDVQQEKNYNSSLNNISKIINETAEDKLAAYALYIKGKILYIKGDSLNATKCFNESLRKNINMTYEISNFSLNMSYYVNFNISYIQEYKYQNPDGLNLINNVLIIINGNNEYAPYALYIKARIYYYSNNFTESIKCLDEALALKEDYFSAWLLKGYSYYRLAESIPNENKNINMSLSAFEKAKNLEPENYESHNQLAKIYFGLNRLDEAFEIINSIPEDNRQSNITDLLLGEIYFKKGDFSRARNRLEKSGSGEYEALKHLGETYLILNETLKARETLKNATKLNTTDYESRLILAETYLKSNDPESALFESMNAIRLNKSSSDAKVSAGKAYMNLSMLDISFNKSKEAIQDDPNNANAWKQLGLVYSKLNLTTEAKISSSIAGNNEQIKAKQIAAKLKVSLIIYLALMILFLVLLIYELIPIDLILIIEDLAGLVLIGWMFSFFLEHHESHLFWLIWVVLIITTGGLWAFLGKAKTPWSVKVTWAVLEYGKQLGDRYKEYLFAFHAIFYIILIIILITIVETIKYESIALISILIKYYLLFLILVNLLVIILPARNLLECKKIDQDTRDLVLVTSFGYLCLISLYISMEIWFWGVGRNWDPILPKNTPISMTLSSAIFALLLFLFMFHAYLSGSNSGKEWRQSLLNKKGNHIQELIEIFEIAPKNCAEELQSYLKKVNEEYVDESKKLNEKVPNKGVFRNSYAEVMQFDPIRDYLKFLDKFKSRIEHSAITLNSTKSNYKKRFFMRKYSKICYAKKREIDDYSIILRETKPQLMGYLVVLFGPVILALIDAAAKEVARLVPNITHAISSGFVGLPPIKLP